MAYNIGTFKLKELDSFKFPVAALYKNPLAEWFGFEVFQPGEGV